MDYIKETYTVEIPKNTGVSGFLETLRKILRLPRVSSITLTPGKVTYVRRMKEEEKDPLIAIDFETLEPMAVIRGCPSIEELDVTHLSLGAVMAKLFHAASIDQMIPFAFCAHSSTKIWSWFQEREGFAFLKKEEFFGLPVIYDDQLPDTALFLCTSYERQAELVDTRKIYKVTLV